MQAAPDGNPVSARTPLVLIVDDDADTRSLYAAYLRDRVCEIDEAEDGREALAKALTRLPDVVVTETRLPGIGGFELCRLLRSDSTTRHTAIVFVTGDAYDKDVACARSAGADAVLTKPCLPETLEAEIQRVLARARRAAAPDRPFVEPCQSSPPKMLSRAHPRRYTTEPPVPPPVVVCPSCDQPLRYTRSHIGGVSERHAEQWDYFKCPAGCGTFQYRQRTRKLRRMM